MRQRMWRGPSLQWCGKHMQLSRGAADLQLCRRALLQRCIDP